MGSWWVLRSPPKNPLSTFKTASAAVWAIGVIGVLPFANTITNAWFLGTLYLPRVLDCINFVEESPGADPSEFPTISGDLLQVGHLDGIPMHLELPCFESGYFVRQKISSQTV